MKPISRTVFILFAMFSLPLFAKQCAWCEQLMLEEDKYCSNCGKEKGSPHWTPIKVGFGGVASLPSISNASVGGLDLEFGAMGDTLCGIGLCWFGEFREIYGVQCSVFGHFNSRENVVWGLQLSGIIGNQSGSVYGIQVGCVMNNAGKEMYGIQIAAVGNSAGKMHGLQIGFCNGSVDMCGIQIGVINTAKRMSGIQIGVLNFIDNSPISFFPVVNMYF